MNTPRYGPGIEINGRITPDFAQILTPEAVAFAARLQRAFGARRTELLAARARAPGANSMPASCPTSSPRPATVREGDWTCAPCPPTSRIAASRSPGRSTAR